MKKFILLVMVAILGFRPEICIGRCIDAEQNGKVFNGDPYYNYISYYGTEAEAGDNVISVFLKNPCGSEYDDIIWRGDIVCF